MITGTSARSPRQQKPGALSRASAWASTRVSGSLLAASLLASQALGAQPLRLAEVVDTGPSLTLSGAVRSRYEHLDASFRAFGLGTESVLATRTRLTADLHGDRLVGQLEILDTRAAYYDDPRTINTGLVNVLEPVNAWLGMRLGGESNDGATADDGGVFLRAGRLTQDLGSRRLVARPAFRNTVNTFTGIDAHWRRGETDWTALAYFPDQRRPVLPELRSGRRFQLDEFDTESRLLGLFTTTKTGAGGAAGDRLELYLLHLDEADSAESLTANRKLFTPGLRWLRPAAAARLDWELELAAQFGTSRATALPTDTRDLDHRAAFAHAELGWTTRTARPVRISLELEYASGDEDPGDGDNNRFTQLFGVTAGDTGPTSIFTAYPHANLAIASLRFASRINDRLDAQLFLRTIALAEARDAWVGTGLRDRTGDSGRDLGDQVELDVHWWLVPGNLRLEAGALFLDKGDFARTAPGAPAEDSITYSWLSLEFSF